MVFQYDGVWIVYHLWYLWLQVKKKKTQSVVASLMKGNVLFLVHNKNSRSGLFSLVQHLHSPRMHQSSVPSVYWLGSQA